MEWLVKKDCIFIYIYENDDDPGLNDYWAWRSDGAKMFTCGLGCDPDTDSSVPMVTNLDTASIARQIKSADEIIRSATFPAAHAPFPDDSSRSEGDRWPYSLTALGTVGSCWACSRCYHSGTTDTLLPPNSPVSNPIATPRSLTASLLYPRLKLLFRHSSICLLRFLCFLLAQNWRSVVWFLLLSCYFLLEAASVSPFYFPLLHTTGPLAVCNGTTNDLDRDNWDWLQTSVCLSYIVLFCVLDIFKTRHERRSVNFCHVGVVKYSNESLCLSVSSALSHICVRPATIYCVYFSLLGAQTRRPYLFSFCLCLKCEWNIECGRTIQECLKHGIPQGHVFVTFHTHAFVHLFFFRLVFGTCRFRREEKIKRRGRGRGFEKKAAPGGASQ